MPDVVTEKPAYYCILTDQGAALEAAAHTQGSSIKLRFVSVGDGGGSTPTPDAAATALVHENYRRPIDNLEWDRDNKHICWVHATIPADVGDWYIREVGVWAEPLDGEGEPVLYAVGNHPDFYKPLTVLGQAMTHELALGIVTSATADVTVVVTDEGYATKVEVDGVRETMRQNTAADIMRARQLIRLSDRITKHELEVACSGSITVVEVENGDGCECHHVEGGDPLTIDPTDTFKNALYGNAQPGTGSGEATV